MHVCTEFCTWAATAEMLTAHGFATEIVHIEKSMGCVFRTVIVEGAPIERSRITAAFTPGSPFRFCTRRPARPAVTFPTPDVETIAWALSTCRQ